MVDEEGDFMFSKRVERLKISPTVKFNSIASDLEENNVKVYRANIGQPDIVTDISYFKYLNGVKPKVNGYVNPQGIEELRYHVACYYNEKLKNNKFLSNDIVISNGASDGVIKTLLTLCDAGDNIIILEPFFSDYKIYCDILDIKIKSIPYNNINYFLLENLIDSKTKAILFANPNNPTGEILSLELLKTIIAVAKKHDLFVISDEVYSEILYIEHDLYVSLSCLDYINSIIIDSCSKKFSNCGSRIGFVLSKNVEFISNLVKVNDCRISISNIEQMATIEMFKNKNRIFSKQIEIYKKRLKLLQSILNKRDDIKYITPRGGLSVLVKLPIDNSENFCLWLLKYFRVDNSTVLLTPANDFYLHKENCCEVRISLTINEDDLKKALLILVKGLDEYNIKGDVKK